MSAQDDERPERAPDLPDREVDLRFDEIVAHWATGERPADDDLDDHGDRGVEGSPGAPAGPAVPADPATMFLSIPVWRGPTGPSPVDDVDGLDRMDDGDEHEDGFIPPEVDLPPGEDIHYWGAVAGLVLGPLLVLYVVVARPFYATWWLLGGIGLIVMGFGLLVLRAPRDRDPDDHDDGARV